jgi:glycosyltransferase involved in cell wall biosynthesis
VNEAVLVVDGLGARFGGSAYAVIQLVRELAERDDMGRIYVVAQPDSIVARGLTRGRKVHLLAPRPWPGSELGWRIAWEAARLPQLASEGRADAVVTMSGMLPRLPACPVVSLLSNPVPFLDRGTPSNWIRRVAIARTSRRARAVYVPTHYMGELANVGERFRVVPWGVDHKTFSPGHYPGDEILYVSDFYPHKRHDLVLRSWRQLPAPRPALRFVGNPDVAPTWFDRIRAEAVAEGVRVDVRLSLNEVVAAYRRARMLVMPSERESFSLPTAEALSCGVPVVARDLPSLRETAGPGALVVRDDDPATWADAMSRLACDDSLHASLREAGAAHARRFSWERFAETLVSDIRGTIGDDRRRQPRRLSSHRTGG